MTRSAHRDPRLLGLVFFGGMLGTAARAALGLTPWSKVGTPFGPFPVAIFGINLVGSFLLGLLIAWLGALGDDTGRRRELRLFFGTGLLGGFTTYGAMAFDVGWFTDTHGPEWAVAYGVGAVVLGVAAAWLGALVGGWLGRRQAHNRAGARS